VLDGYSTKYYITQQNTMMRQKELQSNLSLKIKLHGEMFKNANLRKVWQQR